MAIDAPIEEDSSREDARATRRPFPPTHAYRRGAFRAPALLVLLLVALTRAAPAATWAAMPAGTNLDRLAACARMVSDSVLARFQPGDTVCLRVADHPASWLIDQAALASAEARGVHIVTCDGVERSEIVIAVTSIGIEYLDLDDDPDGLARSCHVSCGATLAARQAAGAPLVRSALELTGHTSDTVSSADLLMLEESGYPFTKGARPDPGSGGFWSKVVEPAVILGASAVMVILLFTVRSQ